MSNFAPQFPTATFCAHKIGTYNSGQCNGQYGTIYDNVTLGPMFTNMVVQNFIATAKVHIASFWLQQYATSIFHIKYSAVSMWIWSKLSTLTSANLFDISAIIWSL